MDSVMKNLNFLGDKEMADFHISKNKYTIGGLVGLCILLTAPMAFATTITGQIQRIRINTGTNNSPRISILMGGSTACGAQGWFAYEAASTGVGLLMTNGLLAAYESQQPITIRGTGTCDAYNVEIVNWIDLLRP
jgi:hypothetical protein